MGYATHGRPADAAAEDHDGVDLGDPVRAREAPLEDVEEDRDREADGEGGEQDGVDAAGPEDLASAQAAEEDRGGEVGVDAGAGEAVFLVAVVKVVSIPRETLVEGFFLRRAEVGDVFNLKVHDTCGDEGGDEDGDDLGGEGVALRDLEVVG